MLKSNIFYKKQFIFVGLLVHFLTAIFSYGAHHSDELFQVFEFAGYKLGLNQASELPWEFHNHMRSGLLPLIVYLFTISLKFFSIHNPFFIAACIRVVISLLSFYAVFLLASFFESELKQIKHQNILWFLATLFWFMPYFHARLLSENVGSTLFVFGLLVILKNFKTQTSYSQILFGGFLMGLSFICRFQISFMIAGFFAWLIFIKKVESKLLLSIFVGFIVALIVGLALDYWLYDAWTISWWNYLDQNLFHHAAANFGEQAVYFYLIEALFQLIPPFSIVFVVGIIWFWIVYKKHLLTWITLPFVLLHFFIGHKELRFLFPLLDFLPVLIILIIVHVENNHLRLYSFLSKAFLRNMFILLNSIALLVFMFSPADNVSHILNKLYMLTNNQEATLLYADHNPYDNKGSLHYFKSPHIQSLSVDEYHDALNSNKELYYFTEEFLKSDTIRVKDQIFTKVYAKFPFWFEYLNINNWVDRATFEIYKKNENAR